MNSLSLVKVSKIKVTPFKKTTVSPVNKVKILSKKKGTVQVKDLTFKRRNSIPSAPKAKNEI